MGKYAALTTAGTFLILNPKKAQAASAGPMTQQKYYGIKAKSLIYITPTTV